MGVISVSCGLCGLAFLLMTAAGVTRENNSQVLGKSFILKSRSNILERESVSFLLKSYRNSWFKFKEQVL